MDPDLTLPCPICATYYSRLSDFMRHMVNVHRWTRGESRSYWEHQVAVSG